MDAVRFDSLARAVAGRGSRRRLLGGLLAGAGLAGRKQAARADQHNCGCGSFICVTDPDGTFRGCCGGSVCRRPDGFGGACCNDDTFCCGGVCCHTSQVCVSDGQCASACPAETEQCGTVCCPAGMRCDNTGACAAPCEGDQIECNGACILSCGPGLTLNADTCACECAGQSCGTICCGAGQECTNDGSETGFPKCCPAGKSCGLVCNGDPRNRCCKAGSVMAGGHACGRTQTCCGADACCNKGMQRCVRGRCKRRWRAAATPSMSKIGRAATRSARRILRRPRRGQTTPARLSGTIGKGRGEGHRKPRLSTRTPYKMPRGGDDNAVARSEWQGDRGERRG